MSETSTGIENIRTLYQEAQQDRRHLSQTIVTNIGYAITVNAGIWAFFLKAYVDALGMEHPGEKPPAAWYLFTAAVLSSIVVVLWRWYTHFLDNRLANLYPDLIDYETKLDPSGAGPTWTHLEELVFKKCKEKEKPRLGKHEWIKNLVDKRRIGCRGHNTINMIAGLYLAVMWIIPLTLGSSSPWIVGLSFMGIVAFPAVLICLVYRYAQMNPSELDIQEAVAPKDGRPN